MKRRVLVTGGAGFIGSRLVRACQAEGWEVAALYQPENGLKELQGILDRVKVYPILGNPQEAFHVIGEFCPELVFHLASKFIATHERDDLQMLVDSNIAFGAQVLEAVARHNVPYLVNAGTSWQHADNHDYEPVNLYAATKQAFQDILEYYVAATPLQAITLKLFDTYGPQDPRGKLFSLLERATRQNAHLEMSPGEQLIDIVHVDDVVRAFITAAHRLFDGKVTRHEIYAISSGRPVPLRELVETYGRVSGQLVPVVWGARPYRPREVMVPWSKGAPLPGWAPQIALPEGIRTCLDLPVRENPIPTVSVCIPVYNCRNFVAQAIESVLSQSYQDFELIILDNASTDGTLEIITHYTDPRVRLVRNRQNLGLEANWNRALKEARGRYVKLLPADDFLYPQCLERQVEIFERPESEHLGLICCARDIVDPAGKRILTRKFPGRSRRVFGKDAIQSVIRSGTNPLGEPASILFRRDLLKGTNGFDGRLPYIIDVGLWLQILLQGDLYILRDPLCAFRMSSGSTSLELATLQSKQFAAFINDIYADPRYGVRRVDRRQGLIMTALLGLARRLVYVFTVQT